MATRALFLASTTSTGKSEYGLARDYDPRVRTIYRRPQMHRVRRRVNHVRPVFRDKTRSPVVDPSNNSPDLVIRENPMCGRFGGSPRPFHRPLHISIAANAIAPRVYHLRLLHAVDSCCCGETIKKRASETYHCRYSGCHPETYTG